MINRTPTYRQRKDYAWSLLFVSCAAMVVLGLRFLLSPALQQQPTAYNATYLLIFALLTSMQYSGIWGGCIVMGRLLTGRPRWMKVWAVLLCPLTLLLIMGFGIFVAPFYYLYNLYRLARDNSAHRHEREKLETGMDNEGWRQLEAVEKLCNRTMMMASALAAVVLVLCISSTVTIKGLTLYANAMASPLLVLPMAGLMAWALYAWYRRREQALVGAVYNRFEQEGDPQWLRQMAEAVFAPNTGKREGLRMAMRACFFCGDYSAAVTYAWETARFDNRMAQRLWGCNILLTASILQEARHDYNRSRALYQEIVRKSKPAAKDTQLLCQDLEQLVQYGEHFFAQQWEEARAVFDQTRVREADGRSRLALLRCYLVLLANARCAQPEDYAPLAEKIEMYGSQLMIGPLTKRLTV